MLFNRSFIWVFAFQALLFLSIGGLSIHRPTLCPIVSWQTIGMTIIDNRTLGSEPQGLFFGLNNTIYAVDSSHHRVLIYTHDPLTSIMNITNGLNSPQSIFVKTEGDLFIDNGKMYQRIEKYSSSNMTTGVTVMRINGSCYSLFVDVNDILYCSVTDSHQIHTISLNASDPNRTTTAAGTGLCATASDTLCFPQGIFVDSNSNLYVADTINDRIQRFQFGRLNGTTLLGNGSSSSSSIILRRPTSVFIDGSNYIYVVDSENHRILRSTSTDYVCIIGCTVSTAVTAIDFAFDSHGNIFTLDTQNRRIQQYLLMRNSCISYNRPQLCHNATWNSTAITYLNRTTLSTLPRGIFMDFDNIFYWTSSGGAYLYIWFQGNSSGNRISIPTGNQSIYAPPFLSIDQEIYFVTNYPPSFIMKKSNNSNMTLNTTIQFSSVCRGLFIDLNNTLYCSLFNENRVASVPLNRNINNTIESITNQTRGPWGLFVDTNFDVYVAEARAGQIRRFAKGNNNGTLVAGQGYPNGLQLSYVTDVILDANNYLYLADNANHRIIRVWTTGYQCLAGCSCRNGSGSDQMTKPISLRFDSYGNLYVADEFNARIQKFSLLSACGQTQVISGSNRCPSATVTTYQTTLAELTSSNSIQTSSTSFTSSLSFQPVSCANASRIGSFCNESSSPCDILQPCLNNGSCSEITTNQRGYRCWCPHKFTGDRCQTSITLRNQTCRPGWKGKTCNERIDHCKNITCENQGVCRSFLSYYQCECLGDSYSGPFCEIIATKIIILQRLARSISYIAIIIICFFAMFIITMDVLKYFFGFNAINKELDELLKAKKNKQKRRRKAMRK